MKVRLQKYLADAGIASRRASEQVIKEGRVSVNGTLVSLLGTQIDPELDIVKVDDQKVRERRKIYLALNKPRGVLCARQDQKKRMVLADLLPREWCHLYPVGRLDLDSEGLLFLTNDGDFCLKLSHPRFQVSKIYRVTVEGRLLQRHIQPALRGITHDGELLRVEQIRILASKNSHSLAEVKLNEGKKREIRRIFDVMGFRVVQLKRIQIGPIKIGELTPGKWRILSRSEVTALGRRGH